MNIKQWLQTNYISVIPLTAIMALTRVHHFGDAFSLPDASLAVFFLAGMGIGSFWFLGFLLLEAGIVDYVAITQFSVNDFCISAAYVFLIPTYAVMWFAGRYCSKFKTMNASELLKSMGLAALATSTAFAISNGSFYLLSGRFTDLSWDQYFSGIAQYYPSYASVALIYALVGLAVVKIVHSMIALASRHKEV
jgi:hypothetical protein